MNKDHFTCRTCNETKSPECFSPKRPTQCKKCAAQYMRERRSNPEFRQKQNLLKKERRKDPLEKEKEKAYYVKYRDANREEINRKSNEAQARNPELRKARRKSYYEKNKQRELEKVKEWREKNPEKIISYYRSEEGKAKAKAWREEKVKKDPLYKLKINLRSRIRIAFRKLWKGERTHELVGCSWDFLKIYLEEKFEEGMTWENYGLRGWHIDHIKALSTASTKEELEALCHYTNLQPLWAKDNWSKGPR